MRSTLASAIHVYDSLYSCHLVRIVKELEHLRRRQERTTQDTICTHVGTAHVVKSIGCQIP